MDFGRQIIRYSIPGGVFGFLTALLLVMIRITWYIASADEIRTENIDPADKPRPILTVIGEVLDPLTTNLLVSVIGMLIAGYLIYQIYYRYYKPSPRILSYRLWRFQPLDRGGEILANFFDAEGAEGWVKDQLHIEGDFEVVQAEKVRTDDEKLAWYRHNDIVRSLVNFTAQSGNTGVKDDYGYRSDVYHSLGACRLAVLLSGICGILYVFLGAAFDFAVSFERTLVSGVLVLVVCVYLIRVFDRNREKSWHAITQQVGNDLAMWFQNIYSLEYRRNLSEQENGTKPPDGSVDVPGRHRMDLL